jgi:hypothetical protein
MDPKLKRWETGLTCGDCGRKVVALTFVKPGSVWDGQKWSRHFVGKNICQRCASRSLTRIFAGTPPRFRSNTWRGWLLLVQSAFFVASLVSAFLRVTPIIPVTLFLGAIGILFARILIGLLTRRNKPEPRERPFHPEPLVSLEDAQFLISDSWKALL